MNESKQQQEIADMIDDLDESLYVVARAYLERLTRCPAGLRPQDEHHLWQQKFEACRKHGIYSVRPVTEPATHSPEGLQAQFEERAQLHRDTAERYRAKAHSLSILCNSDMHKQSRLLIRAHEHEIRADVWARAAVMVKESESVKVVGVGQDG